MQIFTQYMSLAVILWVQWLYCCWYSYR